MEKRFNFRIFRKVFPFAILILLIGLCLFVGYFRSGFVSNLKGINDTTDDITEIEWTFVKAVITEDYLAARMQARVVAEDITEKIKYAYPDLGEMRYELENPQEVDNPEYLKIMRQSTQGVYLNDVNNDENDIFVCTRKGIIMDVSPSSPAHYGGDWESIIGRSTNPELSKNAFALLFNHSSNMIYLEHHVFHIKDESLPSLPQSSSIENLHEFYVKYGLNGLKHVQFLAPAYITDTGDIFGVEDINIRGVKTNNHKIIVVQTFNAYDQLVARHLGELEKFNTLKTKMVGEHRTILIEHAFIVIIAVILVVVITYFMMVFNNVIFHGKEVQNKEQENATASNP